MATLVKVVIQSVADEARQSEQGEEQKTEDDRAPHDRASLDRGRPASEGSLVALGCLRDTHWAQVVFVCGIVTER